MSLSKTTPRKRVHISHKTKILTSLAVIFSISFAMAYGYIPSPLSAAPNEKLPAISEQFVKLDPETKVKTPTSPDTSITSTEPPHALRLAVIIANVPLATYLNPILTQDHIRDLVFNQVNDYYLENSYGRVELTGDVFGMYTLSSLTNENHCGSVDIEEAVMNAAHGEIDFSQYDRAVIYYPFAFSRPNWEGCNSALGFATNADEFSSIHLPITWVDSSYVTNTRLITTAHELGHNFGLGHAGFLNCGNSIFRQTGCSVVATEDEFDLMGGGRDTSSGALALTHMNAPHKAALGWISTDAGTVREMRANETGTFTLEPLETASPGLKALKFPLRSRTYSSLWIEYRQPIGFDRRLPRDAYSGAILHLVPTDRTISDTLILDATPPAATDAWPSGSLYASTPTFHVGSRFQIPSSNSVINIVSATSRGLTVQVSQVESLVSPPPYDQPLILEPSSPPTPVPPPKYLKTELKF